MNKFAEWIEKEGIKQRHIAEKIGVSTSTLHEILRLGKIPSIKVAGMIQEYTEGFIKFDDWYDQVKKNKTHKKNKKKVEPEIKKK